MLCFACLPAEMFVWKRHSLLFETKVKQTPQKQGLLKVVTEACDTMKELFPRACVPGLGFVWVCLLLSVLGGWGPQTLIVKGSHTERMCYAQGTCVIWGPAPAVGLQQESEL